MQTNTSIIMLNTSLIIPNKYQPRKVFDEKELKKLAESIKIYGIINPILVRKKNDKYEIIAGERRFRAAQKIGLSEVPVIIKNADEQQMAELALIENIQRQGLSPIEEAKSYEEIMRIGNQTQASLASKIGKSQSSIANKIRLLSLPQEIQDALSNKKIGERHARSLLSVENKEKQIELLNRIITEKLTVKETEKIINEKEIDEEEIKKAISDIMKSLNIQEDEETEEDKKEEKEDDSMNNGNFFPNFDNNNAATNNASLNMMNMQSMNQVPPTPEPEIVMPTPTMAPPQVEQPMGVIAPQQMAQPIETPTMPNLEQINQPIAPMPEPPVVAPTVMPEMQQPISPMINDAPLFGPQPIVPEPQVMPTPAEPQQQAPITMADEPLFNPSLTMPTTEPVQQPVIAPQPEITIPNLEQINQPIAPMPEPQMEAVNQLVAPPTFEVPVTAEPVVATNSLQGLQDLLNANGYNYKVYGNDTTDCIIIELPRN